MSKPSSSLYFEDLFANTSDLIQFVNQDGQIEIVNPAWLTTLGYELNEVIGSSIYDYISEDDRAAYGKYREECIASLVVDNIQVVFKRKDGKPVTVEGHLRAYYASDTLLHLRGVFRDITLKTKQQKENEAQFLKISNFLENAPDAVVVINESQQVIEWNLKAEKVFGYTKAEVLNEPLSELIIPFPYREAHKRGMQHFLKTGEGPVLNKTIEVASMDKFNREFPISLSISNVKIDDKWFFIAFMEDISEKKKQQEELIRQTLELNEVKLEDERNKEFLNIASHELKTPLTSIKALTQLALRGMGKHTVEQTTEFLTKIDTASDKLKKLIVDLLDVSKIHAGKLIIDKKPVEYKSFLEKVIETSRIIFPSHQIIILKTEQVEISIDAVRVEQVIFNLISNAVKYSPGSNLVEVSVKKANNMLVTSVKDYGVGIEKANQHKVFDKFFQIHELAKTDKSGLGMGLFICSEIINLHKGTIWLQNNEGKGTTFYFALPLVNDTTM